MKWTDKQKEIAEVVLRHRTDDSYDFKASQAELKDISKSSISDVAKALKENNWQIPARGKDGGKVKTETEKSLAGLRIPEPPVVFEVRGEKVRISPEDLYESYFIYLDMKARAGIDDTFSDTLKAGMEILWSLCVRPIITDGGEVKIA